MAGFHKKNLLIGLGCLLAAFLCLVGVFYFLLNDQRARQETIQSLEEHLLAAQTEQDLAEKENMDLKDRVGSSIYLENLLAESAQRYGEDERSRREGILWVDHKAGTLLVTLGALNGVAAGSRLTVLDGDDEIGFVRVETPLDVISYVYPVNQSVDIFEKEYYRVVLAE